MKPSCKVYGVEPDTADTMARSLAAGAAVTLSSAASVAAGLAPPFAGENAFRYFYFYYKILFQKLV